VKQLKVKVRRVNKKRKLRQRYQVELKGLSKELLAAKKNCTGDIFAVSTMK